MKRALTGIKPTGDIHLGNLLGAVRPALALQEHYQAFYFVADYHALTTSRDAGALREATRSIAATFLALGLDTERHVFFRQSDVLEVTELAWILSCQIPPGVLERAHAYKAARDAGREITAGTMFYPVLMAADILLYDSDVVPVGRDQKQHVEYARDMAEKVNHWYGEGTLVVPEVQISEATGVVPGIDGQKMSKSYGNVIPIWAPSKKLRKIIMRITTDSKGVDEPKEPDTCTVFRLYELFAEPSQVAEMRSRYLAGGMGYGHAKQALFEVVDAALVGPRERYEEWMAHPERIEGVLAAGAERARAAARETAARVRARVGLR